MSYVSFMRSSEGMRPLTASGADVNPWSSRTPNEPESAAGCSPMRVRYSGMCSMNCLFVMVSEGLACMKCLLCIIIGQVIWA